MRENHGIIHFLKMENIVRKTTLVELKVHDTFLDERYRESLRLLKVYSINDFYWLWKILSFGKRCG